MASDEPQIVTSDLSLHDLFQRQTAAMLENADLTEEERQSMLIAMSCPCCGAGGLSMTVKLRKDAPLKPAKRRFIADSGGRRT